MPLPQLLVVCWQSWVFCDLQKHLPDLCLHLHMAFSLCAACVEISPFYKNASHIGLGPTLMTSSFFFNFYVGVQLINSVVLVSGVQQSDSVIHIHVSILFQIIFPIRLLQNIEPSSLCYTVGPCWLSILFYFLNFISLYSRFLLSILYILVYICQSQSPNSSHHHPPPPLSPLGVHMLVLYICVSISALQTGSSVPFFQIPHICVNIRYLFFPF